MTKKHVNWTINEDILKKMKYKAVELDMSISGLVEKAVVEFLK